MGEIYTIPPHRSFVDVLARGLLDEAGRSPAGLIDGLVLLPTRRACRTLRDAFLRQSGGRALMLPRIQPIGEVEPEETMPAGGTEADLPPAIGRVRRQLLLARLLAGYDPRMPVEHRLRLADELALLLDELASERRSLKALANLVPDHLAEHWQASRTLLDLIDRHWPSILASDGALDPAERRNVLLDGLARRLEAERPERRIVAAGSTGSIDATRGLLRAILALPRGAVVLPGLDLEADDALWREVGPGHPQGGLKQLLDALGRPRTTVRLWPAAGDTGAAQPRIARTALLRTALRPAGADGPDGGSERVVEAGRAGLEVLVVADLAVEAGALALRMRSVLEDPGRTAMLVTPDRDLARRVAIELRRWRIEVDDSAGVPLDRTPEGALLLLAAGLLGGVRPATLLALLKHPLVRLRRSPGEIRHEARRLERAVLRGPRISGGFAGILTELHRVRDGVLERHPERGEVHARSIELVERMQHAAAPFLGLAGAGAVDLADLIRAHLALVRELTAPPAGGGDLFWSGEAGEAAAELFREILDGARDGHPVAPRAYPALLAQLMTARPVRARVPRHPRLAIFGQLEARLLHADLVLIGGLNEGVGPAAVDPGPWLNRAMRETIGLQPVERRVGLAAHDF
ncbi:MAG TPA: double-strand break repair protein AddB, partial [Geminicoccaceae bacterium]